ncbi:hypothetical protein COOONC_26140 [Cooperia oncophora]
MSFTGTLSLILNDSAFVDVEPRDPEAECLHRLFLTGLFDTTPSEDYFTFAPRVEGMLFKVLMVFNRAKIAKARRLGIFTPFMQR